MSGIDSEHIGLVSLCVTHAQALTTPYEVAYTLAKARITITRWTKYGMNNWLRLARPNFDILLALKFLGFSFKDVREGLSSACARRRPAFD